MVTCLMAECDRPAMQPLVTSTPHNLATLGGIACLPHITRLMADVALTDDRHHDIAEQALITWMTDVITWNTQRQDTNQ